MIRINLLAPERQKAKKALFTFDETQRVAVGATVLVLLTGGGCGWWYWSLKTTAARIETDIVAAQQDVARLQPVLAEVQRFEQRRTQLQQRVQLIEQLREGQSVPVQLLDHVSRSLPDMMWLTNIDQQKGEMTIEGRTTTLIALSDFVGSLGSSTLLQKPIEIVSSQVETVAPVVNGGASADVIKFTVKAQLAQPAPEPKVMPVAATVAGGAR